MRRQRWPTVLFVPGDRPDRVATAGGRGADAVVIDLEDAVAPAAKERARGSAVDQLRRGLAGSTMVRVNAADSGELERDIEALGPVCARLDALLIPKATGPGDVAVVERLLDRAGASGPGLVPIVETAVGVFEARATATASARVLTLMFGLADLSADLGVEPTAQGSELAYARSHVVLAAAAAAIAAPIDGPHLVLGDLEGLARATRAARALGFGGKAVIHPEQIPVVRAGFGPSAEEIAWAERVVAAATDADAAGLGVARLEDGTFIDEPVTRRARSILAPWPEPGPGPRGST